MTQLRPSLWSYHIFFSVLQLQRFRCCLISFLCPNISNNSLNLKSKRKKLSGKKKLREIRFIMKETAMDYIHQSPTRGFTSHSVLRLNKLADLEKYLNPSWSRNWLPRSFCQRVTPISGIISLNLKKIFSPPPHINSWIVLYPLKTVHQVLPLWIFWHLLFWKAYFREENSSDSHFSRRILACI